jgi:hypothetical protein
LPNLPKAVHLAQSLEKQLGKRDLLLGSLSHEPQVASGRSSQFVVWALRARGTDPPIWMRSSKLCCRFGRVLRIAGQSKTGRSRTAHQHAVQTGTLEFFFDFPNNWVCFKHRKLKVIAIRWDSFLFERFDDFFNLEP